MEFVRTTCSDKEKGDQVTITIADEEEQAAPASPQLTSYLWLLYLMSVTFSFLLCFASTIIIYGEKSPLKDADLGWFLLITTIVTVSLTILATGILIFASCYMKSYMKTSHYTVLKTIGSLSGIIAHLSLGCFLIFPYIKLSWIAFSVTCVIIVGIAVGYGYRFLWKHAISYQENTEFDDDDGISFPWCYYLYLLVPLQLALLPILHNFLLITLVGVEVLIYFLALPHLLSKRKNACKLEPTQP